MSNTSGLCMGCMSPLGEYIVCPRCGYDNGIPYEKQYRKPGTVIAGRYIVGRLVHKNGEGGVYVGYDNNVQAKVWIREYFPHSLARRDLLTGDVLPREGFGAQFKALLSDFLDICNEVKRMGVTEPVIPIENVVGDQGTAYAVYRDLGVIPLETWLNRRGGKLPAAEARELLLPLYNTLSNIHARGVIHRGISPYTVYIDEGGKLYLWDFCMSATRTGGSELEAELFNGYSAPEQYTMGGWQGTWTDVYGAAALFYRAVSGFVPPKSTMIGPERPLAPLVDLVMDLPQNISDAVADALTPATERRTQEISAFIARLVHTDLSSTAVYDVNVVNEVKRERERSRELRAEKRRRSKYVVLGLLITVIFLTVAMWLSVTVFLPGIIPVGSSAVQSESGSSEESPSESSSIDNTMPDLSGMDLTAIQQAYGERFEIKVEEDYHDTAPVGQVYDQSPPAGTTIEDSRTVIVYVSKGELTVVMPDLVGMTREEVNEALQKLTEGEFDIAVNTFDKYSPTAKPGTVVSTNPQAGTEFDPKNTRINIFYMYETSVSEASKPTSSEAPPQENNDNRRPTHEEFEEQWYD